MKKLHEFRQTVKAIILFILLAWTSNPLSGFGQDAGSALTITATGTGETTGHIMDVTIRNSSDKPVKAEIGPFFIPSGGQYQPYIVPKITALSIPANGQMTVPVKGYCADIHSPPVPAGKPMPGFSTWVKPSPVAESWKPSSSNGWMPSGESIATVPGKNIAMGHVIDINANPDEAAPLLLDAINRISTSFDQMQSSGKISTPFSSSPEKERESVIQQTFWIYSSALTGSGYKVEDFASRTAEQYENNTGKKIETMTDTEKEEFAGGIAGFWSTFEAVGDEAKVLTTEEKPGEVQFGIIEWLFGPDYDDVKKADDFDKIRRTKYDKYAAARAVNKKTHEEACEEIGIEPDSNFAEACKRVYGK